LQKGEREGLEDQAGIEDIEKVLSSLANEDALRIFVEAEKGIESSTQAITKLNLTQKRYYVSLKRLIEAGLVEKRENAYVQTILGRLCFKMGETLLNAVTQRDQLALADKLMKSNMLSSKEKEEVLGAISQKGLLGTATLADVIHEVKMITDYDYFMSEVIKLLECAEESAYLAANKVDLRVTDSLLKAMNRGVRVLTLTLETGLSESLDILKMILTPGSVKVIRDLLGSRELNARVTEKLSFSFVIVDGELGVIELPHPTKRDFYVAFEFRNAFFCQKLIDAFTSVYEKAREDPKIGMMRKYLSSYK